MSDELRTWQKLAREKQAEVERLRAESQENYDLWKKEQAWANEQSEEVERLRAIETAARVAVTSWDADGVIFPSQVDSIRAALAKEGDE